MFTWKRLFLRLVFLFLFIVIGWTTWYFAIVRPKLLDNPITVYNSDSHAKSDNTSDAETVNTFQGKKISQEENTTDKRAKREDPKNTTPRLMPEELKGHSHNPVKSHTSNHKSLSHETGDRERQYIETVTTELDEIKARLNALKKHSELRNIELANHLNSLSAKEQQAYFENIRSGKVLEEMPPDFFEVARANLQSKEYSEETIDKVFGLFKQEILKYASEAGAKRHLEKLRAYGFVPKF